MNEVATLERPVVHPAVPRLIGGRRGIIDGALPPIVFVVTNALGGLVTDRSTSLTSRRRPQRGSQRPWFWHGRSGGIPSSRPPRDWPVSRWPSVSRSGRVRRGISSFPACTSTRSTALRSPSRRWWGARSSGSSTVSCSRPVARGATTPACDAPSPSRPSPGRRCRSCGPACRRSCTAQTDRSCWLSPSCCWAGP